MPLKTNDRGNIRFSSFSNTGLRDGSSNQGRGIMKRVAGPRKKHKDGEHTSYSLMQTAAYQRLRKKILKRNPLCAVCAVSPATEVDHIIPLQFGGDPLDQDNLQGLCSPCHWEKTWQENRERNERVFGNRVTIDGTPSQRFEEHAR